MKCITNEQVSYKCIHLTELDMYTTVYFLIKKATILYKRYKQNPTQTNVAIQTSNCLDQKSTHFNEYIQIMNIYSHSEAIGFCLHVHAQKIKNP